MRPAQGLQFSRLESVSIICLSLLCAPCIVAFVGIDLARDKRRQNAAVPKPLPRKRRALSTSARDAPLERMGLLGRLPFEIRRMVYRHALGGRLLHIRHRPAQKRMGHYDAYEDIYRSYSAEKKPWKKNPQNGKTALLKTCRQIYVEAAHVLYTTNAFTGLFGDHNDSHYVYFFQTIRPERLASIASIEVSCMYSTVATSPRISH